MLIAAIIFFIVVIALGIGMLTQALQSNSFSKTLQSIHGILAVGGILIVYIYVFVFMQSLSPKVLVSLLLLTFAAAGGLTLVILANKKIHVPKIFLVLHGLIAVAGFLLLVIAILP